MLQGPRVRLRAPERDDLKLMHEMLNRQIDLVMFGFGGWIPRSLGMLERRFNKDEHLVSGATEFAIEVDGKLIGEVGLHPWSINRRDQIAEMGIGIYDRDYLSKGYGREALGLLLDWAFAEQNFRRIWLTALGGNLRAIRSYQACGFRAEGRMREQEWHDGHYDDLVIMGLNRTEWQARRAAEAGKLA